MPVDSSKLPENPSKEEIKKHIVREKEITPSTRPWLKVLFKGNPPKKKNRPLSDFYNENADFLNNVRGFKQDSGFPKGAYEALLGRDIDSAEFDGVTIGARGGQINIADPLGIWTQIIGNVSRHANGIGRDYPNIWIQYGWMSLKNGQKDEIHEVFGIIYETNFGINEDGIMTLTVHFREDYVDYLKGLRFLKLTDMINTDPSSVDNENKYKSPHELLQDLVDPSVTSVGEILKNRNIEVLFDPCLKNFNTKKLLNILDLRIGDKFEDKLDALLARAEPPEGEIDKKKFDYNYEVTDKIVVRDGSSMKVKIRFGWKTIPREDNDEAGDSKTAKEIWEHENAVYVGALKWKANALADLEENKFSSETGVANKTLLSFNLDLKLFNALFALLSSELTESLGKFSDEDWKKIEKDVKRAIKSGATDLKNVQMKWRGKEIPNFEGQPEESGGLFKNLINNGGLIDNMIESKGEAYKRNQMWEDFVDTVIEARESGYKDDTDPVSAKMRALINKNTFKASATIMGDPTFGSFLQPHKGWFVLDVDGLSQFAGYLSGTPWVFAHSKHKFGSDGTYITEIEIMKFAKAAKYEEDDEESDTGTAAATNSTTDYTGYKTGERELPTPLGGGTR